MKVLAINGSERKDGSTAILLNTIFEELNKAGIETFLNQEMIVVGSTYWNMAYLLKILTAKKDWRT